MSNTDGRRYKKMEAYCYGGSCGSSMSRGFLTKEEKIEMLKDYQQSLEKEAQGVKERISELENDED